jgi:nucleotide-binding universal stress UspA family protein
VIQIKAGIFEVGNVGVSLARRMRYAPKFSDADESESLRNNVACLSTDEAMYRNILIATDGSALSDKSVSTGVALAKHLGAAVTVVHVTEPWATDFTRGSTKEPLWVKELTEDPLWVKYNDACTARAATILDTAAQRAGDVGVACTVRHVPNSYPADGILEAANACGCDLIVMCSHGRRGIARFVMGSQTHEVLVRTKLPVLICR